MLYFMWIEGFMAGALLGAFISQELCHRDEMKRRFGKPQ